MRCVFVGNEGDEETKFFVVASIARKSEVLFFLCEWLRTTEATHEEQIRQSALDILSAAMEEVWSQTHLGQIFLQFSRSRWATYWAYTRPTIVKSLLKPKYVNVN